MLFLDTSRIGAHLENKRSSGDISNPLETDVIAHILFNFLENFDRALFHEQVGIIAPYQSQVQHINNAFRGPLADRYEELTRDARVLVSKVDSMQGSERDVMMFTLTRSNRYKEFGFIDHLKRLNVSLTRARKLNICLLYTSPSPRDQRGSRMPSSA